MATDLSTSICDVKYKIVILGDLSVGKTSMIQRFTTGNFDPRQNQTVGIDFMAKNIVHQSSTYRLQLWDTAGQERFRSLIPAYLKDADCAVIVYDVTNPRSFAECKNWIQLFRQQNATQGVAILVGNKTDMEPQRKISYQQGFEKAVENRIAFCQLSAKTGEGIEDLFSSIIENIHIAEKETAETAESERRIIQQKDNKVNKRNIVKIDQQSAKKCVCCYI